MRYSRFVLGWFLTMLPFATFASELTVQQAQDKLGERLFSLFCSARGGSMNCGCGITDVEKLGDSLFKISVAYGEIDETTRHGLVLYDAKQDTLKEEQN